MAQYLFPGTAAQGYTPVPQEETAAVTNPTATNEKARYPDDWQQDVIAARRRLRRRRILISAAATAVLLTPLAFFGFLARHHHCGGGRFGHDTTPSYFGESSGALSDYEPGNLNRWLAALGGYTDPEMLLNGKPQPPPPPPKCKHPKVPWVGNGRYYIDADNLTLVELLVKAQNIETTLTITHAAEHKDKDDDDVGILDAAEYLGDDDNDDDDEDKDKIYIDADVKLSHEDLQDHVKLIQKSDEAGHYSWAIEYRRHVPPHHPPHKLSHHDLPHDHHQRGSWRRWIGLAGRHGKHHKRCGHAHIHLHLPKNFTDLDALYLGLGSGKILADKLKPIQFGQFKAGVVHGLVHVGHINAVQFLEAGAVHGDVVVHHSHSHAILAGTAFSKLHLSDVEAQKIVRANTVSGEALLGHVVAPVVAAGSVSGRVVTGDGFEAGRLYAKSVSGALQLHGTVSKGLLARTVSGALVSRVEYKPKKDDDDDHDDDDDDDDDDSFEEHGLDKGDAHFATLSLATVSGSIDFGISTFTGRFTAVSVAGQVHVGGFAVHFEKDEQHVKIGYVHDDGNIPGVPTVHAKAVTGSVVLAFE